MVRVFLKRLFGGGTYIFYFQKSSTEGRKLGHFEDFWTEEVALSWRQNWDNSETKIASPFVEGSIESSEFRAFDRDLNEGASIFRSWMSVELLTGLWIPWNTPILAVSKMTPEPQKMTDFWKMRFYSRKHQQSTQLTMYYIGRFGGRPKTGVFGL